jgi:CRP-like cAMP-binding protein
MDELDFTGPARGPAAAAAPGPEIERPQLAQACFEAQGQMEEVPENGAFFKEGQASDRMYLLVSGEVSLLRGGKTLDIVKAGEIFGEVAAITGQPRTASAIARKDCKALSLDANKFQQAVQVLPEFALLLMRILNNRVRLTLALIGRHGALAGAEARESTRVFDKKMLEELKTASHAKPPQTYPEGRMVMREGEAGVSMYVVMRGKVAVSIKGAVVERIGPGGVFGEMALVDQSPRAATATTEEESVLLAISRADFLALVKSKPAFAVALLKAIAERLRYVTAQKK